MSIEHQCMIWMLLTNIASFASGGCVGIFIAVLIARKEGQQDERNRTEE
jgi:hypothetical protein